MADKKRAGKKAASRKLRYMQVRLNEEGWRALRMLSLELDTPTQGLIVDALNDKLRKHGHPPVAANPATSD